MLTGHLESFAEKYATERAVQNVEGVKAIAVEIEVRFHPVGGFNRATGFHLLYCR